MGNNMFAYCNDNPVCFADFGGEDAIYVVDYGINQGLPVVGHAYVYLQDSAGKWYLTQFAGQFPDKTTAKIVCWEIENTFEIEKIKKNSKLTTKKIYIYQEIFPTAY